MLFQSWEFLLFCSITLVLYWGAKPKDKTAQNAVLLLAGYFFYGYWKWTFPIILFASSAINYTFAYYISKENEYKKTLVTLGVIFNLGLLCYFKYTNFFIDNLCDAFSVAQIDCNIHLVRIIIPLGVSFYTFQAISFLVDISRKKLPLPSALSFFTMQAFFPQLLIGPIANASKILPQFEKARSLYINNIEEKIAQIGNENTADFPAEIEKPKINFDIILDAFGQIIWGLFKKVIVADSLVKIVAYYFAQYAKLSGSELFVGAIFYSFQIYADFSGYSDMAIGIAKLFGIELSQNFAYPNFSRSIGEFWRRWHKTLSAWFKEYVYFPLGGSKGSKVQQVFNSLTVFTLSGLWHGASWNFVLWGFSNGVLFLPKIFQPKSKKLSSEYYWSDWFFIPFTLTLISFTRVLFRAPDFASAMGYYNGLFSASLFTLPAYFPLEPLKWIFVMTILDWFNRFNTYGAQFSKLNMYVRVGIWLIIISLIATQTNTQNSSEYIYFKF